MPELPEVEVTKQALQPALEGQTVCDIRVRNANLRWPVDVPAVMQLQNQLITAVSRRSKYLIITCGQQHLMIHLGMSGRLRLLPCQPYAYHKHDHFMMRTQTHQIVLHDPRRFGALLPIDGDPLVHPRLRHLGPEPLSQAFDLDYLLTQVNRRRSAIKILLMNARVVVGVGNIYAQESLFRAGIHPMRACHTIRRDRLARLLAAVKDVLAEAIAQGGTSLKDFASPTGDLGYFQQTLAVYGRADKPCIHCARPLHLIRMQGRSTVYCRVCQR